METVEGFYFESEKQAARAQKEADGIKYIKENTKMDDPEVVLKLYNKLIQDEMLSTPVGMAFLVELQEFLIMSTDIDGEFIRPIPGNLCAAWYKNDTPKKPVRNKKYTVSLWINAVLCVIIAGMFLINYMSDNNVNIINYENALVDKYEFWESQLNDREAAIQQKEAELGIDEGAEESDGED